MQPHPRCDAVCHIRELIWAVDFNKILEDCGLNQIRVQFGHAIDLVASNDCQVSHSYHLGLRFLDYRHAG